MCILCQVRRALALAGTGTFGRVRLAELKTEESDKIKGPLEGCSTNIKANEAVPKVFALKIMKKLEVVRLKQVEHIRNEKDILESINHPFLVTLYVPSMQRTSQPPRQLS